jgi:hypothetical protein
MALKLVSLTIGTGATAVNLTVRGNLTTYEDLAKITEVGFTAVEATAETLAKTLNVVTPESALLESGSFKKLNAASADKKKRTAYVPATSFSKVKSAIEASGGLSVGGLTCTTVQEGNRRKAR